MLRAAHLHGRDIDLVYTWVDNTDPQWRRTFETARREHPEAPPWAVAGARFNPHDDLRFSLRSVERFAPFIRTIHVVTNGQAPSWLNTEESGIRLVTHRDLFGSDGTLPTFSSDAIEAFLFRIPGLSEHFLYANDDTMLGAPVEPRDFFDVEGRAQIRMSYELFRGESDWEKRWQRTTSVIRDELGDFFGGRDLWRLRPLGRLNRFLSARGVFNTHAHVMQPIRRGDMAAAFERFKSEMQIVVDSPFRRAESFVTLAFVHYHALWSGVACAVWLNDHLVLRKSAAEAQFDELDRRLKNGAAKLLCFNDASQNAGYEWEGRVRSVLERLLPRPSRFEKNPLFTNSYDTLMPSQKGADA